MSSVSRTAKLSGRIGKRYEHVRIASRESGCEEIRVMSERVRVCVSSS